MSCDTSTRSAACVRKTATDPFAQFGVWFGEVAQADVREPNAMTLATATPDGRPSARMALLKGVDTRGFVFYTNYESSKGSELNANPRAALVFLLGQLERQVRVEGRVERLSAEESDAYFSSRPEGSQLGAWASQQSATCQVVDRWRRATRRCMYSMRARRYRVRHSGAGIESSRRRWNSGRGA